MEELIQKQFGVSVQEFRDTYMTVVPAYYSTIINALDAKNVESLQAIIDEINMVQDISGVPEEQQFETQNSIEQQIQGEPKSHRGEARKHKEQPYTLFWGIRKY